MTVRFLRRAHSELDAHLAHIKARNVPAAHRLLHVLAEAIEQLEQQPRLGSEHALARTGRRARRWFVAPLMLYYDERADSIVIIRIRQHARRSITR